MEDFGFVEIWDRNQNYGMYLISREAYTRDLQIIQYYVFAGYPLEDIEKMMTVNKVILKKMNEVRDYIDYDFQNGEEKLWFDKA